MTDQLMNLSETARYLSVSRDTVYMWIAKHGLPVTSVGKRRYVRRGALQEWIAEREAANASFPPEPQH